MYRLDESRLSGTPRRLSRATILIVLVSLAFTALIWAAVLSNARSERQAAIAAAINANENRVLAFEQYVARTLENAETATLYLIEQYGAVAASPGPPRLIDDPVVKRSRFASASAVDANGRITASSAPLAQSGQIAARGDVFRFHAASPSERLHIGEPRRSRTLNGPVISLTRRITRDDGSFGGIVGVQMAPGQFTDFYSQANVNPRDLMALNGLDGIVRARRVGDISSFGQSLTGFRIMREVARQPAGTYLAPSGLDGVMRYFSYRILEDYPLFVTVGVSRDDILAGYQRRLAYYYWGAGLLTALILLLAWLLISGLRRRQALTLAIMETNAQLREAQRIGNIGDWSYDLDSRAISWSDQMFAMFERDPGKGPPSYEEVMAHFDEVGVVAGETAVAAAIETGEPQRCEQKARLPSGRIAYHQLLAVADKDEAGQVVRLHGTRQDISARKQLENLQADLAHMSRFDAMNTMAGTLAHELNQPLTAASNYLAGIKRLAGRQRDPGDMFVEGIKSVEKQIHLAGDIIRRVRDMIADRTTRYERARLSIIIGDASSLVAMANDRLDMSIKVSIRPDARYVRADVVQIQQVLVNLIRNACEAAGKGRVPEIRITASRRDKGEIAVCVSDNGTGVPDSVTDLFSTFATSKEGGLGIGLSISRTIVEAHGGTIWVEETGKDGTTICFTLPAYSEAVKAERAA